MSAMGFSAAFGRFSGSASGKTRWIIAPRGYGKPRDFPTRLAGPWCKKAAGFAPKIAFSGILAAKFKSPIPSRYGVST